MALALNYMNLMADMLAWTDEQSEEYMMQMDGIIALAETDLLRDLNLDCFHSEIAGGSLTIGTRTLAYPSGCVKVESVFLTVSGSKTPILKRSYEFLQFYAPTTASGTPKFYCEQNEGLYFAPNPVAAYVVTLFGITRPEGLSEATQTTWLSTNAGDLLFRKAMLLSEKYLIATAPVAKWQNEYDSALIKARVEFAGITRKEFAGG